MNKKVFAAIAVVVAMFAGYGAFNAQNEKKLNSFALANVEALAESEDVKCDNSTYIPNEALRSANCAPFGLGGTHLKCKSEDNVCCNPSEQTDCDGVL